MKTPAQLQFQAALAAAYADLFANDADYAFGPNGPTPEALAEKMTDAAIRGSANVTGKGFRRACKAVGIPHTAKAIDAFLGFAAPVKPAPKAVAHRSGSGQFCFSKPESALANDSAAPSVAAWQRSPGSQSARATKRSVHQRTPTRLLSSYFSPSLTGRSAGRGLT